jgi:hypothetical protein
MKRHKYHLMHKCKLCKKPVGDHLAGTLECPKGLKGRANTYNQWGPETFVPSDKAPPTPPFTL